MLIALGTLCAQDNGSGYSDGGSYSKAPDGYYFKSMEVDVTVHADRSYDIVENLHAFFFYRSHGLYRSIPVGFWVNRDNSEAQDGSSRAMRYTKVEIDNIKISENWDKETLEGVYDIRIGSGDVWIEGDHDYRISYTLQLSDDRIPFGDLFFHSVLGTGWNCATDHFSFAIHFDEEVPTASLEAMEVFMGAVGDETNWANSVITYADGHLVKGEAFRFGPYEALSVSIPLPQGYFAEDAPSIWYYLSWALVTLIVCLLVYLLYHEYEGPDKVTTVVSFHAPKGMTSADVGSLIDGSVDDVDLLSIIPWLAAEGAIEIESHDDKLLLHNKKRLDNMPDYVQAIYNGLFESSNTFNVNKADTDKKFGKAWNSAKEKLQALYKNRLNDGERYDLQVHLLCFLFALLVCWARATPDAWFNGAVTHVALVIFTFFFMSFKSLSDLFSLSKLKDFGGCVTHLGCFPFLILCNIAFLHNGITDEADYYIPIEVIYALLTGVLVVLVLYSRLSRMTEYRRNHLSEVLGLREFIKTAETNRLKMLLEKDERYFYRILPYAMVFGMVDEWASKFDGLVVPPVEEFGNADVSHVSSMIRPHHYQSHFNSASKAATAAAAAAAARESRSHSSSGGSYHSSSSHSHSSGGYSGGGSGGGGGRRW